MVGPGDDVGWWGEVIRVVGSHLDESVEVGFDEGGVEAVGSVEEGARVDEARQGLCAYTLEALARALEDVVDVVRLEPEGQMMPDLVLGRVAGEEREPSQRVRDASRPTFV